MLGKMAIGRLVMSPLEERTFLTTFRLAVLDSLYATTTIETRSR